MYLNTLSYIFTIKNINDVSKMTEHIPYNTEANLKRNIPSCHPSAYFKISITIRNNTHKQNDTNAVISRSFCDSQT